MKSISTCLVNLRCTNATENATIKGPELAWTEI
uniref:Uncharacterized protein n=1 Tax=Arundo donax TaxID=35708 RepID=A0A0A9AUL9_ARUDO